MKLAKFLGLVNLIAPVVLAAVPKGDKIAPLVPVIMNGISEAEQIAGATGEQKRAHVLELVNAGVTAANATGKIKLDPAEVQAVAAQGIDTVVSTIHVIDGAKVIKA